MTAALLGFSGGVLIALSGIFLLWGIGVALVVGGTVVAVTFLLIDVDGSADAEPPKPRAP